MIRPRPPIPWLASLALGLAPAGSSHALAPPSEPAFRKHVDDLVKQGQLDYEQGLLLRFQRIFAPSILPEDLRNPEAWPAKSATSLVIELQETRELLPIDVAAALEGYLDVPVTLRALARETEHFRIFYETSGANAVPGLDVEPANGVPDFVERIGDYAELARKRYVEDAGFEDPVQPGTKYEIFFREMQSYGYTQPVENGTQIVLHRSFAGFPPNEDPEGSVVGSAKVTVAHELKHASQYRTSAWSERSWLEADAVWAEDFVFDATNDYLRYLPHGSPVSHPDNWLPGGFVSYEDCLWQHLLAETHGPAVLVEFFERRRNARNESPLASFDAVLRARGSSVHEMATRLGIASFFSGANAHARPFGFEEAASYPTPPFGGHLLDPTETIDREVSGLGIRHLLVSGNDRAGLPEVSFLGDRAAEFAVRALIADRAGLRRIVEVPLEESRVQGFELPIDWANIAFLVVTVVNLETPGHTAGFFLSVDDDHAVGVNDFSRSHFTLEANRPNPFRGETSIPFSLSGKRAVRLSIFDVRGRLVRRLVEGDLTAGDHERFWNGTDERGRPAAPGLYFYRLESQGEASTRQMLLLR